MGAVTDKTLRVLIIDHYDSYTNNILQLLHGTYPGGNGSSVPVWSPLIIRFDQYSWEYFKSAVLPLFDAIILSPGPGRPERESDFGFNSQLIREANIPILGICLGHQGIGASLGAKIIHAPNIKHGQVSQISHDGSGVLAGLPEGFKAVRYNSLVLGEDSLPDNLVANAWTYDPEDPTSRVLMGIRHRNKPIHGVQWHPESVCSSHGKQILSNFKRLVQSFYESSEHLQTDRDSELPAWLLEDSAIATAHQTPNSNKEIPSREAYRPHQPAFYIELSEIGVGPLPEVVFDSFIRGSTADGDAWLDSAKVIDSRSRKSYLASGTFSLSYCTSTRAVAIFRHGKEIKKESVGKSYWSWLDAFQTLVQGNVHPVSVSQLGQDAEAKQPVLQIGLMGYFGYELKRESLTGFHYTPNDADRYAQASPDGQLLFANKVLCFDHWTGIWKVFGLIRIGDADPIAEEIGSTSFVGLSIADFDEYIEDIKGRFATPLSWQIATPIPIPNFLSNDNEKSYSQSIVQVKDAIREGESYEMTLTTKFRASLQDQDPFELYLTLRRKNPAPYSAFMNFPTHHISIMSSSPERFISIDRDGFAEMKPIKGTIGVSPDPVEDASRKLGLATDVKELAENLMIVDLIRSDLHNVSATESITVPKLLHVESYETVHQLVTTIQSRLHPQIGPVQALKSVFPPGSMTGAPKIRSVQLLEEIEHHSPRGPYAGSLGYLCVSGAVDQSVVIRTIVRTGDELVLGAGGAITWLSESGKEWEEVLVKANAVARVEGKGEREDSLDPKVVG